MGGGRSLALAGDATPSVRRVDIECFARDLEERGKARATVARRLCTIVGFYRYAEEEGDIAHSPAVHIRRPRIDYESHVAHLDRNELGAILVAAGLSSPSDHALVSLCARRSDHRSARGWLRGERGRAVKLSLLRRAGRATVVFRAGWEWVAVDGPVRLVGPDDLPEGFGEDRVPQLLRDVFTAAGGSHEDWAEFDRVMAVERRTAVFIEPTRLTSNA